MAHFTRHIASSVRKIQYSQTKSRKAITGLQTVDYTVERLDSVRVVLATMLGTFNVEGCLKVATAARRDAQALKWNVLYDIRAAILSLSTVDQYEWPVTIASQGVGLPARLGILCDEPSPIVTFIETVAQNGGQNVRVFTGYDEAVAWLSHRDT